MLYTILYSPTIATRRTLLKMPSFDQDRLGTNIGKALKEQMRFLICTGTLGLDSANVTLKERTKHLEVEEGTCSDESGYTIRILQSTPVFGPI